MLIVINLSKKMIGFNLFESFFYTLKNNHDLVFLNNTLNDELETNYENLKTNIQNILYTNHANSFSLCLLYDRELQNIDPIQYSIISNIQLIKKHIINPLSNEYIFHKFYYLSLDSTLRNQDFIPIQENIRIACDLDSKGYIEDNNTYSKFIFSKEEFNQIDNLWNEVKNNSLLINQDDLTLPITSFQDKLKLLFDTKINLINEYYPNLNWYSTKLTKIYNIIIENFKEVFSLNSTHSPSDILKNLFKTEISTNSETDTIIIRIDFNEKDTAYNQEALRYRKELEIIAIIIFLATSDTKLIFEENKSINRENHWQIKTILNEEMLSRMFDAYDFKLKTELSKMDNLLNKEIEYKEFFLRNLNFLSEMKKPLLPLIPDYKIFPRKKDNLKLTNFVNSLYHSYLESIEYMNKRIVELTLKLRIQKEADCTGKVKKTSILEFNSEVLKLQKEIQRLQENISNYKQKEILIEDSNIKYKYDKVQSDIENLMNKRFGILSFLNILNLIILIFLCIYILIESHYSNIITKLIILSITIILPIFIYIMFYLKESINIKNKINKKIEGLVNYHDSMINDLFLNDKETVMYIKDIYKLIMLKKYINECNLKIEKYNKRFNQYNYHYDKLKNHLEINNRLIELLKIKEINIETIKIDNIKEIDISINYDKNPIYCPLSYLLIEEIKSKVIVNEEQRIDIDNKLISFVDKFIITYDKEYNHD